ncbi:hypothetical protein [Stygiolobus caldivivus]|uniref:Uncharacterized protein n=1 Tax=Stygiolobus caldivivus TaxID=2824673 RepID=A0A8D5U3P5_9CREN|nr:hypothetical protein [Stygiolobus caldivivus]BCU68845.1 hypothetical protein KN1_01420 [Stygiolobus caldivivus]
MPIKGTETDVVPINVKVYNGSMWVRNEYLVDVLRVVALIVLSLFFLGFKFLKLGVYRLQLLYYLLLFTPVTIFNEDTNIMDINKDEAGILDDKEEVYKTLREVFKS